MVRFISAIFSDFPMIEDHSQKEVEGIVIINYTQTLDLLERLSEDFQGKDFTLNDVINYNADSGPGPNLYGLSNLTFLLEMEFIGYDENQDSYFVAVKGYDAIKRRPIIPIN